MNANQKNQLILQGRGSEFDLAGILQMIEAQGMTGDFQLGQHRIGFYAGAVNSTSSEPVATVAAIVGALGVFTLTKRQGPPAGTLHLSLTALLLEAARASDELVKGGS